MIITCELSDDPLNLTVIEHHDFMTFVSDRPRNQWWQIYEALRPHFEPSLSVVESETLSDA